MKGNPLKELGTPGQSSMINSNDTRDISDVPPDAAQFAAEESTPEAPSLEQRLAALKAQEADLDNYKKRIRNEMSEHEARTREAILCDFLEVADNLERAIASWEVGGAKDVRSIRDGVDMVLRLLHEVQKGYRAGERLLRPATVVVASAPPVPRSEISRPDQDRTANGSVASGGRGHRRHW